MKNQGVWVMRAVVTVLVAFVLVYMGYHIYDAVNVPIRTTTVVLLDTEETCGAAAVFVRDESPLAMPDGVMRIMIPEGEKVSKGQTIALTYDDSAAMKMNEQLEELKARADQLDYVSRRSTATLDINGLDQQIRQRLISVINDVDKRKLAGLEKDSLELKTLLFNREFSAGKDMDISLLRSELSAEIAELSAMISGHSSVIEAAAAGVFCSMVDGLEQVWTLETLKNITVSQFNEYRAKEAVFPGGNTGRLAQGIDWYLAMLVPGKYAKELSKGGQVRVRFNDGVSGEFQMKIDGLSEEENGQRVLTLNSQKYLSQFAGQREMDVEIVFAEYKGLRVPKDAVRVDENGKQYVFCLVLSEIVKKPIYIINEVERENYYLARYDPLDKNSLLPSDEVVVAGKDLYNGKIIRRNAA